ncbi:MAG: hypothetical protein AABW73_04685 [Nanoarchaeota archaeon]
MQKRLRPTLREKKRYLLIKANKEQTEKAILEFIGILGYAKAGIKFVKDEKTPVEHSILAINREKLNEVRASLMFKEITIKKVSGTIKGLLGKK